MTTDPINHPQHYIHPSGVECIQITEHMSFCLGNAIKYIWRADSKGAPINDLRKAIWYLEREITRRTDEANTAPLVTKSDSSPNLTGNTLAYAQSGDARRQYEMGKMCYYGDGMPQDSEQAVEWWKLAAAQGNADAQLSLASAYRTGTGVDQNQRTANYWLEQAGLQRTEEQPQ